MRHKLFLEMSLDAIDVKHKDVVFKVYGDGKKFGELRVSKGAVVWRGRNDKFGRKIGWTRFDRLMQEEGRLAELRSPGEKVGVPRRKRKAT